MIIDIVFLLLTAFAIFKGFNKGFIIAVFSFLAFLIGLAAAMKLSVVVAHRLTTTEGFGKWWPAICFVLIFVIVALLVRLIAGLIHKTMKMATLGWLNIIGGVMLYFVIFMICYSIVLFYATKLFLLEPDTIAKSYAYPYLNKVGPKAIEILGNILPVFKGLFADLQEFFAKVGSQFMPKS